MESIKQQSRRNTLYFGTMVIELVCGLPRAALVAVIVVFLGLLYLLLINNLGGYSSFTYQHLVRTRWPTYALLGLALGYSNVITSFIAYIGYGSGSLFTRFVLGAREASTREEEQLQSLFTQMVDNVDFRVWSFSKLYILDSPFEYAYLIGTTLYVSSGAIRGQHLSALIAHEFGHLNNQDGSVILALRRLVFPLFALFLSGIRDFSTGRPGYRAELKEFDAVQVYYSIVNKVIFFLFALWGGGIGVWLLSWNWASYFRDRDYLADAFAVELGFKDELLDYLEQNKFFDTSVQYMLGWQPSNELRIDAIENPARYGLVKVKREARGRPQRFTSELSTQITLDEAFYGRTRTLEGADGEVVVTIPPGVSTGTYMLQGQPAGGDDADLYPVRVEVLPNNRFQREGNNLKVIAPVDLQTAAAGGSIAVSGIDGVIRMRIPPGTRQGSRFRLAGRGMPVYEDPSKRGDLLVTVQLQQARAAAA